MKELNKIKVDFSKGVAELNNMEFEIFTDTRGLKIFTNEGVVFLTEKNAEVV